MHFMMDVTTKGLATNIRRRLLSYKKSFVSYIVSGCGIFARTAYIFFACALPVIAFGEQLSRDTDGMLGSLETLTVAALCGMLRYLFDGHHLFVPGVSEPTVILYTYMYKFSMGRPDLGPEFFLPWAAWVCTWTAVLLLLIGISNTCAFRTYMMVAGDTFRMLVSVLFLKQAVKGLVSEFTAPISEDPRWLYTYGLLAIVFLIGLSCTAFKRSRMCGKGGCTRLITDYGFLLMVLICVSLSFYVPSRTLSAVPERFVGPLFRESKTLYNWTLVKDMGNVRPVYILAAFIPALMMASQYSFEHSVASLAAGQTDLCARYEIFLLGFLTLVCGLIGLPPPASCVLHKSSTLITRQLIRNNMVGSAQQKAGADKKSESAVNNILTETSGIGDNEGEKTNNLITSILLGVSICAIPLIQLIPTSVLWGYFAYAAVDNLPGAQFWERMTLLFSPPGRRHRLHSSISGSVPYRTVVRYTVFQIVYFSACFSMAWIPISGICFLVPFFILAAIRQRILSKLFDPYHLLKLGEAEDQDDVAGPSRFRVYMRPK